jgi:hypothetical protein
VGNRLPGRSDHYEPDGALFGTAMIIWQIRKINRASVLPIKASTMLWQWERLGLE